MGTWAIHLDLQIHYQDDDGTVAPRQITVKSVSLDAEGQPAELAAHCDLTGSFRRFARERITACHDPLSGEPVPDLPALLRQSYARSRAGRLEALQNDLADEITVLLHLGRADGVLQQREKELIATYLCERQQALDPLGSLPVLQLAAQIGWLEVPSRAAFETAAQQLAAAAPQQLQPLYALCVELADVREAREGDEQPALDHLQACWFPGAAL